MIDQPFILINTIINIIINMAMDNLNYCRKLITLKNSAHFSIIRQQTYFQHFRLIVTHKIIPLSFACFNVLKSIVKIT